MTTRALRKQTWEENKATYCRRAKTGYPEVSDPSRAAYLKQIAQENCTDGYLYRGGDATQFAIGQDIVDVSPLQLAVAYAAIANGGTVWHPRLAKAVINQNGLVTQIPSSKAGTLPVSQDTLQLHPGFARGVVSPGTSSGVFAGFPISTAGKTGTAETFSDGDVSWYASYGPTQDPRYAIVIVDPAHRSGRFVRRARRQGGVGGVSTASARPAALPGGQEPAALPCVTGRRQRRGREGVAASERASPFRPQPGRPDQLGATPVVAAAHRLAVAARGGRARRTRIVAGVVGDQGAGNLPPAVIRRHT